MIFTKFWQRHKRLIFIAILFVLPTLPLVFFRTQMPRLNLYDRFNAGIVLPLAEGVQSLGHGLEVIWSHYLNLVQIAQQNEILLKQNQALKQEILTYQESKAENERLTKLLGVPEIAKVEHVVAKTIGQDTSFENLSFFINVGSEDGIHVRMPVISVEGIVGTITRVYKNSSVFVTILDPSHDVDGIVTRTRARMIVEGKGKPLVARTKYLDRSDDVRVGDLVVTSGMDGIFPKGLPIGSIIKVDKPQAGVVQEAELRAAFDMGHLEEVLVLKYSPSNGNAKEGDGASL